MSTLSKLPVILISAANEDVASKYITELVDNDVTGEYTTENTAWDRVWRLVNKYYTADVRVLPLLDGHTPQVDLQLVEAQVILISEEEMLDEQSAVRAAQARARGGWRGAHVRLVAPAGHVGPAGHAGPAGERGDLAAWALCARAELLEPAELPRARDALHAHVWPGLRAARTAPAACAPLLEDDEEDEADGDEADGDEADGDEGADVERAEQFAAALGALAAARATGGAAAGREADAARRRRAEDVLREFCRALGQDLDFC